MTRLLFRGSNLFIFRVNKVVPVAKSVQAFYKPISPKNHPYNIFIMLLME